MKTERVDNHLESQSCNDISLVRALEAYSDSTRNLPPEQKKDSILIRHALKFSLVLYHYCCDHQYGVREGALLDLDQKLTFKPNSFSNVY